MKTFKQYINEVKKPTGDLKKACWTGYTAVGMKMKGGRKVPNCVPEQVVKEDGSCKKVTENINHTYGKNEKQQHTHVANQDLHFGAGHVVKKGSTLRKVDGSSEMYVHLKDGKPVTKTHPILSLPKTHVTAINEDGMAGGVVAANNVGAGNIAGSGGKGGEPGVNPKNKKGPVLIQMAKRKPPMA